MFFDSSSFKKKLSTDHGFTMVDVLAAILIATGFFLASLQAAMISTIFRVKADQSSQATVWIQENIEEVKFEANQLAYDSSYCGTYATQLNDVIKPVDNTKTVNFGPAPGIDFEAVTPVNTSNPQLNPKKIGGNNVWLFRYTEPDGNILKVTHLAVLDNNDSPSDPNIPQNRLAEIYTEVIPDAVFKCN